MNETRDADGDFACNWNLICVQTHHWMKIQNEEHQTLELLSKGWYRSEWFEQWTNGNGKFQK